MARGSGPKVRCFVPCLPKADGFGGLEEPEQITVDIYHGQRFPQGNISIWSAASWYSVVFVAIAGCPIRMWLACRVSVFRRQSSAHVRWDPGCENREDPRAYLPVQR